MTFFGSEIVKEELKEIEILQEKISCNILSFHLMSKNEKLEHIKLLEKLLERQKILYARLSLSDNPDAIEMKNRLDDATKLIGLPGEVQIGDVFQNMFNLIEDTKRELQNE